MAQLPPQSVSTSFLGYASDPRKTVNPDDEMFARLSHNEPRLREYLQREFDAQMKVLLVNHDEVQLRISQGTAQFAKKLLDQLDQGRKF